MARVQGGSSPGRPGPYSCCLAAINRARSRYDAAAKRLIPPYRHNESKLMRTEPPMSNEKHHAINRTLQWHKEWLLTGEAIMHSGALDRE